MIKQNSEDTPEVSRALVALGGRNVQKTPPQTVDHITEDEMVEQHRAKRVYPYSLSSSGMPGDAFKLWYAWMKMREMPFVPDSLPWVPVGRLGPVLVMGHCQGDRSEAPPVPEGLFQEVMLNPPSYGQQLRATATGVTEAIQAGYECQDFFFPQSAGFAWPGIRIFKTIKATLDFITANMPLELPEMELVRRLSHRPDLTWDDLPPGLRGAVWYLMGKGPVIDTQGLKPPGDLVQLVPQDLRNKVIPISSVSRVVFFATSSTDCSEIEDRILTSIGEEGWKLRFVLQDEQAKRQGIDDDGGDHKGIFVGSKSTKDVATIVLDPKYFEKFDPRNSKADPKNVFLWTLYRSLKDGVSDLHIEPGIDSARVRQRVDGGMIELLGMEDSFCRTMVSSAKSLIGMRSELFEVQDHAFSVKLGEDVVNVRVSAVPIRKTYQKLVMRFLPRKTRAVSLEGLDQPPRTIEILRHAINRDQGLILVCGPTGSGKTTTLYACLGELIKQPDLNIITAEDPVEYEMQGVNQVAVDRARDVTFEKILEAMLRQDPDVCLIGEIRSRETVEIALQASLTGHLVFATLHTLSSSKAVQRLLDLGANPNVIAEGLVLVQSQRLLRRLCPRCREPRRALDHELRVFEKRGLAVPSNTLFDRNPSGCAACRGKGLLGRIAVMELLPILPEISDVILDPNCRSSMIDEVARRYGFTDLMGEALKHVANGNLTFKEARSQEGSWEFLADEKGRGL